MAFVNPNDSSEILYGSSGDVRNEINAFAVQTTRGHYVDETEIPGSLVISALEESTREINLHLEAVYPDSIPFTAAADVPKYFDKMSKNMATYFVWRASYVPLGNIPDDKKKLYYDQYTEPDNGMLSRIREGKIEVPELQTETPADTSSSINTGRSSIFNIDDDLSQQPDPNLLDDIQRDRNT